MHRSRKTDREGARLALSLSSDLFYNVTKGYAKPAKHLCMGVGIKIIKGSEKSVKFYTNLDTLSSAHRRKKF